MNRREWLTRAGAAAGLARPGGAAESPSRLRTEVLRLKLRHTWTTTMSSSDYRDTLLVRYARDGRTGVGEGAPIVRYGESAVDGEKALQPLHDRTEAAEPMAWAALEAAVAARLSGQYTARAALNIA